MNKCRTCGDEFEAGWSNEYCYPDCALTGMQYEIDRLQRENNNLFKENAMLKTSLEVLQWKLLKEDLKGDKNETTSVQ